MTMHIHEAGQEDGIAEVDKSPLAPLLQRGVGGIFPYVYNAVAFDDDGSILNWWFRDRKDPSGAKVHGGKLVKLKVDVEAEGGMHLHLSHEGGVSLECLKLGVVPLGGRDE